MEDSTTPTASQIMRAAERLFAEKGVDSVSMREIALVVGSGSPLSVEVHFGQKVHLLDAVMERHTTDLQTRWWEAIESAVQNERLSVRNLIEIMVLPTIKKLSDPDGGREFLALAAQLVSHPIYRWHDRPVAAQPGGARLFFELGELIDVPPQLMPLRIQRLMSTMYRSILEYADLDFVVPADVFASDLIDTLVAMASAPVSVRTSDIMDDNDF